MTAIDIISLISFLIPLTTIICGLFVDEDDLKGMGLFLLLFVFVLHVAFQAGAVWQHNFCNQNYELIEKK